MTGYNLILFILLSCLKTLKNAQKTCQKFEITEIYESCYRCTLQSLHGTKTVRQRRKNNRRVIVAALSLRRAGKHADNTGGGIHSHPAAEFSGLSVIEAICAYGVRDVLKCANFRLSPNPHFKYPPKYLLSYIAKKLKGRPRRVLREEFPHLKEWCGGHLRAPGCFHGSVGDGRGAWRNIFQLITHTSITGNNPVYS